jgi:hypothetical protein
MTHRRLATLAWVLQLVVAAQGASAEIASSCAPTVAPSRRFSEPSPSSVSRFWYGSEALAVLLSGSGTWQGMGPRHKYRNKLFWWRQGYNGGTESRPELSVSARRLDGEAPPGQASRATNAYHKDFGGWAMLVMVEFPAGGCWEVTGHYKGETLSFVVQVG